MPAKKIMKILRAAGLLLKQPSLLNNVLNDNEVWHKHVEKNHQRGNGLPVVALETLFPEFEARIPLVAFLDGGSMVTDHALLISLAKQFDNCTYFEIGTWRGESVYNVASVAKECYTLNLSDEEMRRMGLSEEYIDLTAYFSKEKPNIHHLRGNSFHFDFGGLNKKFDLIFIDGDHHYKSVLNDTKKVVQHLMHENSVVVWHDYAKNPENIRFEILAGILDGLPASMHKWLYHVENSLSAIYINKPFETDRLVNPSRPNHYFEVGLKRKDL